MKMFARDGSTVDIPDDQVQAAFQSGQYAFPASKPVNVVEPETGKVGSLSPMALQKAIDAGYRVASKEEGNKAYLEEHYKGAGHTIAAAGLGAIRGVTLGLSDPLIAGIGGEGARTYLSEEKEAHPIASGIGEVGGALGTLLVPGAGEANLARAATVVPREAGAIGSIVRAATVLPRGVASLGSLAERAAVSVIGEGSTNLAVRLGQKALAKGAAAAAEGAIYNAGQYISESALGDHELSADKLLESMGHGALLGGLFGGGLGALGEIGGTIFRKVSPKLENLASEQAFRSLNPKFKFTNQAARVGGEAAVGRTLLDEGVIRVGDTIEKIAPRVQARLESAGERIGSVVDNLDSLLAAGEVEAPNAQKILRSIQKKVIDPIASIPGHESIVQGVQKYMDSFLSKATDEVGEFRPIGFRELHTWRAKLDDLLDFTSTKATKKVQRGIRSVIENQLEGSIEAASKKVGGSLYDDYKDAKLIYSRLKVADNAAQDAVRAAMARRNISPTDYLTAIGGVAHFGPSGVLAGVAHHIVRERGNATMAVLLDKMSSIGGVTRAIRRVDKQTEEAIDRFVAGKRRAPKIRIYAGHNEEEEYEDRLKHLEAAAGDPDGHRRDVENLANRIRPHTPNIASAFERATLASTAYLASKAPKPARPVDVLLQSQPRPTDAQKAEHAKIIQTIEAPSSIIGDMSDGTLIRSQVAALRATKPKRLDDLQSQVSKKIAGKPLTYGQRVQANRLLEQEDPTHAPVFQKMLAGTFDAHSPPPNVTGLGGSKRPVKGFSDQLELSGANAGKTLRR